MERLTFKAGGFNAFNNKGLCTYGGMQKDGSVIYIGDIADKLAEYEDLEEQGLLLKLPCKRGDIVYFIKSAFSTATSPIAAKVVSINGIDCDNDVTYSAITNRNKVDRRFKSSDIGKTVFLTQAEAEEALKGMEENK